MFRRLPRLLVTVALACSVGLHWSLLQSVAWTTMLVGNLQFLTISEAVQRSFDGKHPCALCKAVAEGKKSEKKSETVLSLKKFDGLNQAVAILFSPPASFSAVEARAIFLKSFVQAPPTPPPRVA